MKSIFNLVTFSSTVFIAMHTLFGASPSSANTTEVFHPQPNSVLIAASECTEYKKRNGDSGKQAATDAPSWVKTEGLKPCKSPNEDGKSFAKRVLDAKYGTGNYKTGATSEYSQIQKYGDRSFE
jgi:hypothetical protein